MAGKSKSQRGGGNRRGSRGQGGNARSRSKRPATNRQFPRTARLNTLLQEIVADFFERVDDDRFEMLTVTGVEVDSDLNRAQVFVSALGTIPLSAPEIAPDSPAETTSVASPGPNPDQELLDALADYRKPVQAKIGREARIRKTPEVVFAIDPAVRSGARIDEILATINPSSDPTGSDLNDDGVEPATGAADETFDSDR
mgnify:CR=1 FL=1